MVNTCVALSWEQSWPLANTEMYNHTQAACASYIHPIPLSHRHDTPIQLPLATPGGAITQYNLHLKIGGKHSTNVRSHRVSCWSYMSLQHQRSYQDGHRPVTVCIRGDVIVLPHWEIMPLAPWPDISLSCIILTELISPPLSYYCWLPGLKKDKSQFDKLLVWLDWELKSPVRPVLYWFM